MGIHLSRRGFLVLLGGGLASATFVGTCGTRWTESLRGGPPTVLDGLNGAAGYVDHDGWMLTAADKEKVAVTQIETPDPPKP